MTAIACLRILLTAAETASANASPAQVEAAADLYLKHRWKTPRRCGLVAPLAFVLADSRGKTLVPEEIQALAVELETTLFPGRKGGQVCLMTFEGDESSVLKFASLSQSALAELVAGEAYSGAPGQVRIITADQIRVAPNAPRPKAAPASPAKPPLTTGWQAIYHLPGESVIGAVLGHRADLEGARPEDDNDLLARDLTGLNDAQFGFPTLRSGDGALFLPFSFWNLSSASSQEAYKRRLSRYPLELQPRLGATVYDTPREPSIGLLQQIRALLQGSFAHIDLCIQDPNFPINTLQPDIATSISLELRDENDGQRLHAIAEFASRQGAYHAKHIRQAVLGVRSARELEACRAAGLRFVAGPAVSILLDKPPAAGHRPAAVLPLAAA